MPAQSKTKGSDARNNQNAPDVAKQQQSKESKDRRPAPKQDRDQPKRDISFSAKEAGLGDYSKDQDQQASSDRHRYQSEDEEIAKQQEDDKQITEEDHDALSSIGKKAAEARWHGEKAEISDEMREAMSKIGRKGGHSSGTGESSGGPTDAEVRRNQEEDEKQIEEKDREALSSIGKKAAAVRWHGDDVEITDQEREAMSKIGRKGGHSTGTGAVGDDYENDPDYDPNLDNVAAGDEDEILLHKRADREGSELNRVVSQGA